MLNNSARRGNRATPEALDRARATYEARFSPSRVRIPAELAARLAAAAERLGESQQQIVARAIARELGRLERAPAPPKKSR